MSGNMRVPGPSVVPLVPIDLDRRRHLRLSFGAVKRAEQALGGRNLVAAFANQDLSATDYCAVLWAALLHEDPSLTLEQVEDMIPFGTLVPVSRAINQAYVAAMPAQEKKEAAAPLAASPPPGTTSGLSAGSTSGSRKRSSGR